MRLSPSAFTSIATMQSLMSGGIIYRYYGAISMAQNRTTGSLPGKYFFIKARGNANGLKANSTYRAGKTTT